MIKTYGRPSPLTGMLAAAGLHDPNRGPERSGVGDGSIARPSQSWQAQQFQQANPARAVGANPMWGKPVGGTTNWDVANFGSYSGFGTSQGGISGASYKPQAPAGAAPAAPQAGQPQAGQPQAGQPQAGQPQAGQPQAGQPSQPQPQGGKAKPGGLAGFAANQTPDYFNDPFNPHNTTMPGFAGGTDPAQPLPAGQPAVVGEHGPEVIVARQPVDIVPTRMFTPYGTAAITNPGDLRHPLEMDEARTVMVQPDQPVLPPVRQQPVPQVMQVQQQPALYQPVAAAQQYAPAAQPTIMGVPVRRTDMRRFVRKHGAEIAIQQQEAAQRIASHQQSQQAAYQAQLQADQATRQQAKAEKEIEELAASERADVMAQVLSGKDSILSSADQAVIRNTKGSKEKGAVMDTLMKLRLQERKDQAEAARNRVAFTQEPGTDYLVGRDATGRVVEKLAMSKADPQRYGLADIIKQIQQIKPEDLNKYDWDIDESGNFQLGPKKEASQQRLTPMPGRLPGDAPTWYNPYTGQPVATGAAAAVPTAGAPATGAVAPAATATPAPAVPTTAARPDIKASINRLLK